MIFDGPADGPAVALAHGAGAAMDSPFLNTMAAGLAGGGLRVARFEFPYMRRRRETGERRPPDREPALRQAWLDVIATLGGAPGGGHRLVIGGKSMGGRMASLVADEAGVRGLVCLGYPFHPPGQPEKLRTAHLRDLRTTTLIVQGTRDPLGTREEVEQAARRAHAHEFVTAMPEGYDAMVGERGVKLSGGQRQRIAIARVMLKDAPLLVLDEATASLDSLTEVAIQSALDDAMLGKTVVVIAHRFSTIAHLDRILVFSRGQVVEDGTHQELLAQRGSYAALWFAQSKLGDAA
jgi:predicted alpha/beta-hydrolase family hydrolase